MSNLSYHQKTEKYLLDEFYRKLVIEKVNFIKTKSSYHRKLLYQTLEKYGKEQGEIWCQRKKEYVRWNKNFCREHRKPLLEKYHDFIQEILYHCEDCDQAIDPEDTERYIAPLEHKYLTRQVVGLNIFYQDPKIKKIKHFGKK